MTQIGLCSGEAHDELKPLPGQHDGSDDGLSDECDMRNPGRQSTELASRF